MTAETKYYAEITIKSVILAIFLAIVLGAANTYLGLKVGITVSASIPAAVISMGILHFFRNHNILENNIVQTAASAGEALAAGVAFTAPALIVLHVTNNFHYWQLVGLSLCGGIYGVLFTVPLRRFMITSPSLNFPEGTAIANVLKATGQGAQQLHFLLLGAASSALIDLSQTGFRLVSSSMQYWTTRAGSLFGIGVGFSPALIGAGYIIGIEVGLTIFAGIVVGWIIGVPVIGWAYGVPNADSSFSAAMMLWQSNIRYIGVGAMFVGGIWSVISLLKPLLVNMIANRKALHARPARVIRTEKDIPNSILYISILLMLIPVFFLLMYFSNQYLPGSTESFILAIATLGTLLILVLGYVIAAVVAYIVGLVGSSASPISGLTIITLIITAFCLELLSKHFTGVNHQGLIAIAIVISIAICVASAIANDTMQDLKTGQLVGATPWKQQIMLILGVVTSALVIPAVLELLFQAYGIAGTFPRAGMDQSQALMAPQASIMATIVTSMFNHDLPWNMLFTGGCVASVFIVVDVIAKRYGHSFPAIGIGLGIYLPLTASTPLLLGAIISYLVNRKLRSNPQLTDEDHKACNSNAVLVACGYVAGASLMGVCLAIPFIIAGSSDALNLAPAGFAPIAGLLGVATTLVLFYFLFRAARPKTELA